ncbi:MAG: hypothetical protein L7V85_07525, partial [Bacteroidia bacterium]|nr:hypothetical protein [Bacteroidia bacterium]
ETKRVRFWMNSCELSALYFIIMSAKLRICYDKPIINHSINFSSPCLELQIDTFVKNQLSC